MRFEIKQLKLANYAPVSMHVNAGECVCISGPSGGGKTRLLRAMADLDPHGGSMQLNGDVCGTMAAPQWRTRVGFLAADSQWWESTVGQHFLVPPPIQWLQLLDFDQQVLSWQVDRLSTGERQRLALLRLLANQPQVLLLDEPTANLDPQLSLRVESLVDQYRHQHPAAVIWVSHSVEQIARMGDRHFQWAEGRLQEVAPCN